MSRAGSTPAMAIKDIIKAARDAKGLSMEQVAAAVGVRSWQTVQQWENGKTAPSRKRIQKVAEVLGINEMELITGNAEASDWPFSTISREKVARLTKTDRMAIEAILLIESRRIGIDLTVDHPERDAAVERLRDSGTAGKRGSGIA